MLIDKDGVSVKELLQLFNETENLRSKQVVRQIFDEVGYGWFVDLDETTFRSAAGLKNIARQNRLEDFADDTHGQIVARPLPEGSLLSDDEFLDLLPVSSYFH
jgi:hypothetical protein